MSSTLSSGARTAPAPVSSFGPYSGPMDAREHLCRFVDAACGPTLGVAWATTQGLCALRPPIRDADGIGATALFRWGAPRATPRPAPTEWQRVERFFARAMAQVGEAQVAQAQAQLAAGREVVDAVERVLDRVPDNVWDAAGVALDVVGVAAGIGIAVTTGFAALGAVAGTVAAVAFGSAIALLVMDGTAFALEMAGHDQEAEQVKQWTETARLTATVLSAIDGIYAVKMVREIPELRTLVAEERAFSARAGAVAAQSRNADRAARARALAEKSDRKAALNLLKLRNAFRFDMPGKGADFGSVALMLREEELNDRARLHRALDGLQVHVVAGPRPGAS